MDDEVKINFLEAYPLLFGHGSCLSIEVVSIPEMVDAVVEVGAVRQIVALFTKADEAAVPGLLFYKL